jgi:hypothetical protein
MVPGFLLHDAPDMSIRGVSGKKKFGLRGRMLEGNRRRKEAFCILGSLLCHGSPLQRFGPPLSGDQLKGATPVHNYAKNGGKSLPCQENVAIV